MEQVKFEYKGRLEFGNMSVIEGELLSLEVTDTDGYTVGGTIVFLYAGKRFPTKIIKKEMRTLYLFVPLFDTHFPNDRRHIARIPVQLPAYVNDYISERVYEIPADLRVRVIDVSLQGFGFVSGERLRVNHAYYVAFDTKDLEIKTKTIIRNETMADEGYRYGCEIQSITREDFHVLRRFMLIRQLSIAIQNPLGS
ncbi:PilZ domain-containing protein [Aneurinibacillus soli]|uniref:PilZ domain protein n=1 Tax=Aneurinibacillus soli TaxID=1500254 RepID=A0A0U4WEC4_9BACL|nr:PilZ domain-containing protein [Aneurinibacillus soli]PYE62553.1 PilZ domain-containing protein [Aneurinibacillus soli]BAU27115.1 PilZ domain protein [Aneurinibacillus soli]